MGNTSARSGDNEVTMATKEPTIPEVVSSSVVASSMLLVAATSTPLAPVQTGGGNTNNEVH